MKKGITCSDFIVDGVFDVDAWQAHVADVERRVAEQLRRLDVRDARIEAAAKNRCTKTLECGGRCAFEAAHEDPCECISDEGGPGTCPA